MWLQYGLMCFLTEKYAFILLLQQIERELRCYFLISDAGSVIIFLLFPKDYYIFKI